MRLRLSLSAHHRIRRKHLLFSLLPCLILLLIGNLFVTASAQAAAVPGGRINDPVVRAVDIAKPAVVRIVTTVNGTITVHFTATQSATFPLDGSSYAIKLSGSGAFISSNGDILTADHVIHPPHDKSMDQELMQMAAKDVATYINNNLYPTVPYTAEDAFADLYYGIFRSASTYSGQQSEVYLSQDYTGSYNATELSTVPQYAHSPVTKIEKESAVDQKDVAIVHVNMTDTPSIQLADSSNVAQQDELTIIGFPGNGDLGSDPSKIDPNMLLTASVNKIYVSSIKNGPNGQALIQVGGNVEHGDSGGPALDSQGHIVGIVSFYNANAVEPIGTSFLQASNSAQALISSLALNTTPGRLEKNWQNAFAQYASTAPNHWHNAHQAFQQLATDYPKFAGLNAFVDYTGQQAQHEKVAEPANNNSVNWLAILIAIIAIVAILVILGVVYIARRDRKRVDQAQTALAGAPVPFTYPAPTPALAPTPASNPNTFAPPTYQTPVATVVAPAPVATPYPAVGTTIPTQPETPPLGSAFAQQPSPAETFARYRPTPLPAPQSEAPQQELVPAPEVTTDEHDEPGLDATQSTAIMPAISVQHTADEQPAIAVATTTDESTSSDPESASAVADEEATVLASQEQQEAAEVSQEEPGEQAETLPFDLPTYRPETDYFADGNASLSTDTPLKSNQQHAVPNGIEIPEGWYEGLEDIQKRKQ